MLQKSCQLRRHASGCHRWHTTWNHGTLQALPEPQWLKIDVRTFDMTVLGKFGVIMADPPWEIHQDLPYGTMSDDEMRKMNIGVLQDDGVIFLWVTGECHAAIAHAQSGKAKPRRRASSRAS